MIDTHTQLNYTGRLPDERRGLSAEQLVDRMNREGIDKPVLLPIESPEVTSGFCITAQAPQQSAKARSFRFNPSSLR